MSDKTNQNPDENERIYEFKGLVPNCKPIYLINDRLFVADKTAVSKPVPHRSIHTSPFFVDTEYYHNSFVFSKNENAETDASPKRSVCLQGDATPEESRKIVIDDSYPSIDAAAMAAANKIITKMKTLNCEYSVTIYKCSCCEKYFLSEIKTGYKTKIDFECIERTYTVDKTTKYDFVYVALVHSHPIIRENDWCPDIGEHISGKMKKACSYARCDEENDRFFCTFNENYTGGNHDFSTEDYIELYKLLKTSAVGYLVAKKGSDEWTLMKFEWPKGNDFKNGVRVWNPGKGQWDNVIKGDDGELLKTALYTLKDDYIAYNYQKGVSQLEMAFPYACACRTLSKAISDIIIGKNLLKEMSVTLNFGNLSNDGWKASIESDMAKKGWKAVSKSLEYERISENCKKTILRLKHMHGRDWQCDRKCVLSLRFMCDWR